MRELEKRLGTSGCVVRHNFNRYSLIATAVESLVYEKQAARVLVKGEMKWKH
jgi:hypothetical protein